MAQHLTSCVLIPHFPVQVAQQRHPAASAVPLVVVTGASDRAIVVDVCVQAMRRGVQPGMHLFEARRRVPSLHVVLSDTPTIEQAAARIEAVLARHADVVHQVAMGCWTFPLYALGAQYAQAEAVAARLREEISAQTGFVCVLGIAAQPAIARIAAESATANASDHRVVHPGTEQSFLAPLPIRALPGVGGRTEAALRRLGITTVGQLAQVEAAVLATLCGPRAQRIARAARGFTAAPTEADVATMRCAWQAADEPEINPQALRARLYLVTVEVGRSLRARGAAAGTITVRVTWTDGTVGRHHIHWRNRSDLDRELAAGSRAALDVLLHERRLAVRELVVTVGDLGARQMDLFVSDDDRPRRLQQALDRIAYRYGATAVQPGSLIRLTEPIRRAVP